MFVGFVDLDETLSFAFTARDAGRKPVSVDSAPSFRVYGPSGVVAHEDRLATRLDVVDISGVSGDTPISVSTSADHGWYTGDRVTIADVGGATAADGTWTITKVDDDTFTLDDSDGGDAYTSGGTAHLAGLWRVEFDALASLRFDRGAIYVVRASFAVDGDTFVEEFSFQVT